MVHSGDRLYLANLGNPADKVLLDVMHRGILLHRRNVEFLHDQGLSQSENKLLKKLRDMPRDEGRLMSLSPDEASFSLDVIKDTQALSELHYEDYEAVSGALPELEEFAKGSRVAPLS